MMPGEVTLVGELNPYGGDDYYALYPAPDGCSGHRLCCRILGMRRTDYLDAFLRTNLCSGTWNMTRAVAAARLLRKITGRAVLCGAKVCRAFMVPYEPFEIHEGRLLVIPHPSGACRAWNIPATARQVRATMKMFYPEIADLIGVCAW